MTRFEECNMKIKLVRKELRNSEYAAVVIRRQPNFSWITSGGRGFIGLASENSCAAVIITREEVCLAVNNIEAGRLLEEELPEGFARPIVLDWTADGTIDTLLKQTFGNITEDSRMDSWFKSARTELNLNEIQRYKALGSNVSETLEAVCLALRPGQTEFEIAGELSRELWSLGIEPVTLLVAADDRSCRVRHYVPTANRTTTGVIVSLCARSGGLVVSATRSVAFRKGFASRYEDLLSVEQAAFEATAGYGTVGDVVKKMMSAYEENGFPEEWKNHHQGGMTGYLAREIRAEPDCVTPAGINHAYAWNPSASGIKCEDTVIKLDSGVEVITPVSAAWPKLQKGAWVRPGVLKMY